MATRTPRAIVSTVRAFARRHDILRPGPLVVAVSGGADSTALALILAELADEFGLVLHVAHFDHRTRPRSAAADAQFVADLASRIGAPIRVGRATAAPKSEEEARDARFAFLRRVANEIGATAIATGHTIDDQAETVLLHLTRGSGLAGLAAMRPLRDGVARPLLAVTRQDTVAICRAAKVRPREDPTNRSLRFARNRVRLRVLPELARINPQVRAALARFADAAAQADDELARSVAPKDAGPVASARIAADGARVVAIDALPMDAAPRQRALADAWRAATGKTLNARNRAALEALTRSTDGSRRLDLPGGAALREYGELRLGRPVATTRRDTVAPLDRGSSVTWHGWRISLDVAARDTAESGGLDAASAARLSVRARRAGDRLGRGRKLQDLFVDAKVPARLRDTWPIVALDDVVLWVPGLSPAPTRGPIAISAERVGDGPTAGEDFPVKSAHERQVASKTEARRRGGKRGRP